MNSRRFVAIDGESFSPPNGGHNYVLMACSVGDYVFNENGLSTKQCFDYLLNLRRKAKRYIFVAFGLNYDVNMMLRDIPPEKLERLWKDKRVTSYGYQIEWIPGKWFSVKRGDTSIRIYDVFGFFQASFVTALKRWGIEPQEDMEAMKAARSDFDSAMKEQIIAYCIAECTQLVELMDSMHSALKDVDLVPSSWMGAGSLAAALLKRHKVRESHCYDSDWPKEVTKAIYHSYFGGRVELFKQGNFERLVDYDVVSAYPSQALSLPNLKGGTWEYQKAYSRTERYALWFCEWDIPSCTIAPFPFRSAGNIYYPSRGRGWYHAVEVKRALEVYPQINVLGGWAFTPADDTKPFDWIREVFKHRAELKEKGHAGEKVLKLGYNAVYGKLAQGYGFRGKLPRYQNLFWAGYITSGTRARLFDIASQSPAQLVMIATDGIFFEEPAPDVVESKTLGGWEKSILTDVFVAQPGVYQATDSEGNTYGKSRGFFAREINWDDLRDGMRDNGPNHIGRYTSRRFVGLGSALTRNDELGVWRTWAEGERKLSLYPSRKFIGDETAAVVTHVPPEFKAGAMSEIYKPKATGLPEEVLDYLAGMEQPLREF